MRLVFVFIFAPLLMLAQTEAFTIKKTDFAYYFSVNKRSKNISTKEDLMYHWYHNNELSQTQGDYYGFLLQDEFVVKDRSDRLCEKGHFNKGLKKGEWKKWATDGSLISLEHFKGGLRHGEATYYERGRIKAKETYYEGLLNGKRLLYDSSGEAKIERYRHGVLIISKTKIAKVKEKKEEVPSSQNKSPWYRLFNKKASRNLEVSQKKELRAKEKKAKSEQKKLINQQKKTERKKAKMLKSNEKSKGH